ncbi:hypothetical protein Golob_000676 [Gossypium lobatum]|uniref:Uncharacterized protein n=1 Tax=Gossypium lobatum TaxID=34289 RepID=A0A7J8N996_9ROSI|nr:hypothetical protein [Gossypium lobatum]
MQKQSSTVERERTKSTLNEVVGVGDGGLGSRFVVMYRLQISEGLKVDMTNVAPREGERGALEPIRNEAALLDNVGLDIFRLILKSLEKKPIVNVGLSIISSGPVEACNVDSKSIKKVCTASSSCTKLFVIRDEIESRNPMIIPLSDNQ